MPNKEGSDILGGEMPVQAIENYLKPYKDRLVVDAQLQEEEQALQADTQKKLQSLQAVETALLLEEERAIQQNMETGEWTESGADSDALHPLPIPDPDLRKVQADLEQLLLKSLERVEDMHKRAEQTAHLEKTLLALTPEELGRVLPVLLAKQVAQCLQPGKTLEVRDAVHWLNAFLALPALPDEHVVLVVQADLIADNDVIAQLSEPWELIGQHEQSTSNDVNVSFFSDELTNLVVLSLPQSESY